MAAAGAWRNQKTYTQGYSNYTTANHERRTAEQDAAFLLPHIKKTDRILDVGCGPGTITTGLAKYASEGTTIGIDISAAVLEKAKTLLAAAESDIPTTQGPGSVVFEEGNVLARLPYPDGAFDVVYSSQVFGHLLPAPEMPRRALAEIRRVLKPGGVLATRDAADTHFYPRSLGVGVGVGVGLDLDRLWTGNLRRSLHKGAPVAVDGVGPSMPALMRSVGFEEDKVRIGASAAVSSGPETRRWLAWRAAGQLQDGDPFYQSWLDAGITKEEIQETLDAVRKWAETDDAWLVSLQCEMLARK